MLIKIYRPNSNPNFPKGGKMTPYLEKLEIGALINVESLIISLEESSC